jgi:hypothetical protein
VHKVVQRLSEATIQQLVSDYRDGTPTTVLTSRYNLGKGTVLRLLRPNGAAIRHQPLSPDQVAEVIRLYREGWSLSKVAQHIGRHDSLIHLALKRARTPRRDSHGRER